MKEIKKINIGAGLDWMEDGWETLDNVPGKYLEHQHFGKCWDSNLDDNSYDIVFSSHTLEHIPQFKIENTIAEFNRILKIGGVIRILVPNLKLAAKAYLNGDKSFFKISKHYSDEFGIGGSFMRLIISPGSQTLAISREYDEVIGGYAHLYCFDYEIMQKLLKKWGFGKIRESKPGKSLVKELRKKQYILCNGKKYSINDDFVRLGKYKEEKKWSFGGFDKDWGNQLAVEAIKVKDVKFEKSKVFIDFSQNKFDSIIDKIKLFFFRLINKVVSLLYELLNIFKVIYFLKFVRSIFRKIM